MLLFPLRVVSDRPLNLYIIDNDPIFRLGLSSVLGNYGDFHLIGQGEVSTNLLETLSTQTIDLIIVDPDLPDQTNQGWDLCRQIKENHSSIKVCLMTYSTDFLKLQQAKETGIEGYCPKGTAVEELIKILQKIAQGQTQWKMLNLTSFQGNINLVISRKPWLARLKQSGINQINQNLHQISEKLQKSHLSRGDKLFWSGRKRELLAARWLVNQLIPVAEIIIPSPKDLESPLAAVENNFQTPNMAANSLATIPGFESNNPSIIVYHTLKKIKNNTLNLSSNALEIDIFKPEPKEELITIIIHQLGRVLEDLKFLETTTDNFPKNSTLVLQKIWQESALNFMGKYCVLTEKSSLSWEEIEDIIDEYTPSVQEEILAKIPFVSELLKYLLFNESLVIDQVRYRAQSPEAQQRAEMLLHNLLIGIANGIVSLILNNFSELETIRLKLYNESLISSREIARFRNHLSWLYRQQQYWEEPKNIFESQYRLLFWSDKGIEATFIHAPRQEELKQLDGLRWVVTIILETRDAFAPLLRSVVGFIGNGLVYVLTQVVGKGLGLIGRGIIQGIGNSLQETRYGKNRER